MNIISPSKLVQLGILSILICTFAAFPAAAANLVDIHPGGPSYMNDTIYAFCQDVQIEVSIENDFVLGGMSLGFRLWIDGNVTWQWYDAGGYGSLGSVTLVPGARLDENSFDMTGFQIIEQDVDGISPDTIMAGGVAMFNGVPVGPLQHMYTMHFMALTGTWGEVHQLCLDDAFVPPSGAFVFVDMNGQAHPAGTLWPGAGQCWPMSWPRCAPPEWDPGLPTQIVIDGCQEEGLVLSASDLEQDDIYFDHLDVINGGGTVTIDNHGDGTCDVFYIPAPEDVGQDITIPITVGDYCFGYPCTPTHDIHVSVVSYLPSSLDCGAPYASGATNNPIIKSDISGIGCGDFTYSMLSGPGDIDLTTGIYTWTPGPSDTGLFPVEVQADDGVSIVTGSFTADVIDEACCPGDANFSGSVDVSDAVFLINYVFKGGPAPKVANWGDANADCNINVGDIVYLIAFIFNSGPAPVVGCVY